MVFKFRFNCRADLRAVLGVGLGEKLAEEFAIKPVVWGEKSPGEVGAYGGVFLDRKEA